MRRVSAGATFVVSVIAVLLLSASPSSQGRRIGRFEVEDIGAREAVAREVLVKFQEPPQPLQIGQLALESDAEGLQPVGRTGITFRTLNLWSQDEARVKTLDYKQLPGRYYLRFTVEDRPGVLAEIAGVLGKHQISIASVIQHEPSGDGPGRVVPLVIMTQKAQEGAAQAAVAELDRLQCVKPPSVRMRVLD